MRCTNLRFSYLLTYLQDFRLGVDLQLKQLNQVRSVVVGLPVQSGYVHFQLHLKRRLLAFGIKCNERADEAANAALSSTVSTMKCLASDINPLSTIVKSGRPNGMDALLTN